jgi:uncharacterized protein YukE
MGGGVKAQFVTFIGNGTEYGSYFDDFAGPTDDQNVLINNNPNASRIIGPGANEIIDPTAELNFLGGEDNAVDGNAGVATANFLYGRGNNVMNSSYSIGLGTDNTIIGGSENSLAVGEGNGIDECKQCASIGIDNVLRNADGVFSIGAEHNNTDNSSLLLGFGNGTNALPSIGERSISLGTFNNNTKNSFNTLNIRPPSTAGNFSAPVTGIGITSPDAKLSIKNTGGNSSSTILNLRDAGSNKVFTVKNNGNVGIGTSSPSEKLVVDGNIKNNGDVLPGNVSSGNLTLGRSGNRWYTVWTQTNQINGSDRRLKSNIDSLTYGMEEIMQLNPVSYKLKDREKGDTHLGLIAQQLEKVIQEPVETGEGEKQLKGVRYPSLIPVLINGMQEQQKQVQKQQDEIKELKANLEQEKAEKAALEEKVNQLNEKVNQLADQVNCVSQSFNKADEESLNQKTATLSNEDADQAMLLQNRPNPYSDETVIPYYLPENSQNATMLITNTQGQMLKRIPLEGTGKGELTLQTADLNKGQYQYTLIIDGRQIQTRKMIVK